MPVICIFLSANNVILARFALSNNVNSKVVDGNDVVAVSNTV